MKKLLKKHHLIAAGMLIALSACASEEADSDTDTAALDVDDGVGGTSTTTPLPNECIAAVAEESTGKMCFLRDSNDPAGYTEIECSRVMTGHTWVRAISASTPETEIWVLVPQEDSEFVAIDPVEGDLADAPLSLIYSPGPNFAEVACGFEPQTTSTCPEPASTGSGQNVGCLGLSEAPDVDAMMVE